VMPARNDEMIQKAGVNVALPARACVISKVERQIDDGYGEEQP